MKRIKYPNGKEFAFTILDDTDDTTVANGRPVYNLLKEANIKITKTVWAFDTARENQGPYFAGETLESPEYLDWVHELDKSGFEIAFHNASMGTAKREKTINAINFLRQEFGKDIRLHCNHGQNRENLYWGSSRYNTPLVKLLLKIREILETNVIYEGNIAGSPFFWGDIAKERISYMRSLSFNRLNGFSIPPKTLYYDDKKPFAPVLFNTADAPDIDHFNSLVTKKAIDNLRDCNGWAIVSTHIGKGFYRDGKIDPTFCETIEYLKSMPGYYVPVTTLLDYLRDLLGITKLNSVSRFTMESQHILDRIRSHIL